MRFAASLAIAFLALAGNAHAESRDCEVRFVRAPDDVRLVIESWLAAEPRCSGTIELRVVETESGSLYLIAQRPDGRIHEREVPDAQSAGVLVASWVADDWTSSPPDGDATATPAGVPPAGPSTVAPVMTTPFVADGLPPAGPPRSTGRWFSATALVQTEGRGGLGGRVEMDLLGGRSTKWTLGAALAGATSSTQVSTWDWYGHMDTTDVRALVVGSRTLRLGDNWNVRASAGIGPMYTDAAVTLMDYNSSGTEHSPVKATGASMVYEMGLTIARELFDHRWAITAGMESAVISQTLDLPGGNQIARKDADLLFTFGARYRL